MYLEVDLLRAQRFTKAWYFAPKDPDSRQYMDNFSSLAASEILIATNSVVIRQQKDFFIEKCIALFIETVRFSTSPPVKGN